MHYVLFYEVADNYIPRRAPFRDEHLEKAWKASERGELILGGAFVPAANGAMLLFRGDSPRKSSMAPLAAGTKAPPRMSSPRSLAFHAFSRCSSRKGARLGI